MGIHAPGGDVGSIPLHLPPEGDSRPGGSGFTGGSKGCFLHPAHGGSGLLGHHIGHLAAPDFQHHGSFLRHPVRAEGRAIGALFQIDHRVIRIRGEGLGGTGVMLQIILHVVAADLLRGAQDGAAALFQIGIDGNCRLHGVQCQHGRPLVVVRAPAVEVTVPDLGIIGGRIPAVSLGNHIQVGKNSQLAFCAVHIHLQHIALQNPGFKPQLPGNGGGLLHSPAALRAEGRTGGSQLRLCHAGNPHQPLDVGEDQILILLKIGLDLRTIHSYLL